MDMNIRNLIAGLADSSKVKSNRAYSNKDNQSFLKILDQSFEGNKLQKNFDNKIERLEDRFALDMTSIDNIKNLIKGIDANVDGEKEVSYKGLKSEDLSETSLNDIISSLEILISNNMNLTNEEVTKVKQNIETKISTLEDKLTVEIASVDKIKNLLKDVNENLFDGNNVYKSDDNVYVKDSNDLSKELIHLLQEVKLNLNMNSSKEVLDKNLVNEISYKNSITNFNEQKIIKENLNPIKTSDKLNKLIDNIASDKDLSETSLNDIISSLEILISNNMNLTNEEVTKVKQNIETKISTLEDKLTVETASIDKLKNLLKDINVNLVNENLFSNKNNVDKSDDNVYVRNSNDLSKELIHLLQEVKANLSMNSSKEVLDKNLVNEISYKNSITNFNEQKIIKENLNPIKTSDKLNKLIDNIASDKDLSETSLKDIISLLETLISNNMNLSNEEVTKVKQNIEAKISILEDKLTVETASIDKLKNLLKDINVNLVNENLFSNKNNVDKSDGNVYVKDISNLTKELIDLLQEVKININMNSSKEVLDKNLVNEISYKNSITNANEQKIIKGNLNPIKTPDKLNKLIDNIASDKDLSETSLKDIVSLLENLISNNINLSNEEVTKVKQNIEAKISTLEDKLTVEIASIDKLKNLLKDINVNLLHESFSNNKIKHININLVNENLFSNKNNVDKSDDNVSVKDNNDLNKELIHLLQEVKTNLNMNSSKKDFITNVYQQDIIKENLNPIKTPDNLDKLIDNIASDKDLSETSLKDIISSLEILISNNMNLSNEEVTKVKQNIEAKISTLEDKFTENIDSIYKIKKVLNNIDTSSSNKNVLNYSTKNININLSNQNLLNKNNISDLTNNIANEKVSYKESSEELLLKNLTKDSSEDNKISKVINFMAHLNSPVETTKVESEEQIVINKDTIVKDILKSVEYMETNNLKNLTVKINPKELGEVIIKVTMESGTMKANITAQNKEIFNLLNSNLAELNNKLETNNIRIESFTINIYEDTTFFMGQSSHENNGNNQKRKNPSSITKESNDEIEILNNLDEELNNLNMFA